MENTNISELIKISSISEELEEIATKILTGSRICPSEGIILYEKASLGLLAMLSNHIREKKHGDKTFFNKNFHIEPTNICIYNCRFCSYRRKAGDNDSWDYSIDEILEQVRNHSDEATEVHIVGGVHPKHDLHHYGEMIQKIKEIRPNIHVKAFTAVELDFMIKKAGMDLSSGLRRLKEYGLDSIPGGGAEIFAPEIREKVCDAKSSGDEWLRIHEAAHREGIPTNATILYGHIEKYEHRIDHLDQLRQMQDRTGLFNTFIPLKYRKQNNFMSHIGEVTILEDLKNYAVSRIYLDNFDHIKAYWPMIGKDIAQLTLSFGVDDLDGTIDDSTKIYSMAGVEDQTPSLTTVQLVDLIKGVNRIPVERDTLYNELKVYD